MQTFLPYADFAATARVLDNKRLGKQRVEAIQIMRVLLGVSTTTGWSNHPAVKMWRGHEAALWEYTRTICNEWQMRGYANTKCEEHLCTLAEVIAERGIDNTLPSWFGRDDVHASHRSNLVRKLPDHYGTLWPDVSPADPYVWPS